MESFSPGLFVAALLSSSDALDTSLYVKYLFGSPSLISFVSLVNIMQICLLSTINVRIVKGLREYFVKIKMQMYALSGGYTVRSFCNLIQYGMQQRKYNSS